jgi:2-polyprenyl-6-methoxyphenol hydroxylase-like FAD-dependent oxidoreductase
MAPKHVIVIGGSVAGLAAAVALMADGQRVTILERDATPMPESHVEAFERWDRRGSPQTRHSHAFLGRLYCILRDRAPDLLAKLIECGAEELRFTDIARRTMPDAVLEPGDADMTLLAVRRITFEWVLRRHVLDSGRVAFRDGDEVMGLAAERDPATGLMRVYGVHVTRPDGTHEIVRGDLVVDASGRRSKLPDWLEAIGAKRPAEESEPCGIFYSSRFYRLRDGVEPPVMEGGMGQDLGYMKIGIFPGDARIFSLTLAASPEDDLLRSVLRTRGFETAAAALPITRDWVDPKTSEPISDVHGMANLRNTRRWLVADGEPLALGVVAIGDALIHTNPITGRGCSLAWVSAFLLADLLRKEPDDPRALALGLDAAIEREVVPWWRAQVQQDRDALEVEAIQARGENPFQVERADGSQDPKAFMRSLLREGLGHALREEISVLRAFMRVFNLLDAPEDLMRRPEVMQRVIQAWNERHSKPPLATGPSRAEMLALLGAASSA